MLKKSKSTVDTLSDTGIKLLAEVIQHRLSSGMDKKRIKIFNFRSLTLWISDFHDYFCRRFWMDWLYWPI